MPKRMTLKMMTSKLVQKGIKPAWGLLHEPIPRLSDRIRTKTANKKKIMLLMILR